MEFQLSERHNLEESARMDGKILSGGGKEILIKSVVQAIPTYLMALFKLPRGLCDQIISMVHKEWIKETALVS
jgi:hypothetical protein